MDFTLHMPANVKSGDGCVLKNSGLIKSITRRCMIVTSPHAAKASGALDDLIKALEKENISYAVFDQIKENPLVETCMLAGKAAKYFHADCIIGIGGGSPLDAAKAVAVFAQNEGLGLADFYKRNWEKPALPIILIGTTAGTGSEVSATAVLTQPSGMKKSVTDDSMYATLVLADPKYTRSMNRAVSVSTALDALCHAVEGFLSPRCTDIPMYCAKVAIPMLWQGILELQKYDTPGPALRERLYYGSLWAGLVMNALGTSMPHPLGYVLTEEFDVPHGRACAAFLPRLVLTAMEHSAERAAALFDMCGCDYETIEKTLLSLSDTAGIRMNEALIERCRARWKDGVKNFKNVPGGFTGEMGCELIRELFTEK